MLTSQNDHILVLMGITLAYNQNEAYLIHFYLTLSAF